MRYIIHRKKDRKYLEEETNNIFTQRWLSDCETDTQDRTDLQAWIHLVFINDEVFI